MSVTTTPVDFGQGIYILNGSVEVLYENGYYVARPECKGGSIRFSPYGGFLYEEGKPEPVGSIYLDDTDTAEYHTPYYSRNITRECECGHGHIPDTTMIERPTALEVIVEAAFMFLC